MKKREGRIMKFAILWNTSSAQKFKLHSYEINGAFKNEILHTLAEIFVVFRYSIWQLDGLWNLMPMNMDHMSLLLLFFLTKYYFMTLFFQTSKTKDTNSNSSSSKIEEESKVLMNIYKSIVAITVIFIF